MMTASSLGVIPRTLRAEQLKRLSFLCGLAVTGRKDELIARLTAAIDSAPPPSKSRAGPVVLSIDLGIRNLAFSLLGPVSSSASASASASRKAGTKSKKGSGANPSTSYSGTNPPVINLHTWQRLSLLESATSTSAGDSGEEAQDVDTVADAFAPATLAKTANAFLQETVLQFRPLPTHILIERQRWRSRGAAAIQEWTVRVNTLEAMLHASLRTLRDVGVWKGEVISIRPASVGQLFLDVVDSDAAGAVKKKKTEEDEVDESTTKSRRGLSSTRKTSAETKKLKIELLSRWLGQEDLIVRPHNRQAGRMLDAYRDATKGGKRSRLKRVPEEDGAEGKVLTLDKKLDDLTDSLMQGMAWLRWQENLALLRSENGVERLLESSA